MNMKSMRSEAADLTRLFLANWMHFLAIHVAVSVLVFTLLTPTASLLLRLAVSVDQLRKTGELLLPLPGSEFDAIGVDRVQMAPQGKLPCETHGQQLRVIDPDYDVEKLRGRIRTRVVLIHVAEDEDPALYLDLLRKVRAIFDDPSVIALVRREELIDVEQELAPCLDQICLLPIEPSMLLETIRNADQPDANSFLLS